MIGPVLDASGVAVTGSVVGDFKISKNGAAPAALDGSATLTHRHTGNYSLALTANDLDTVGTAQVTCDDTVNACAEKDLQVIEEAIYDALFAASANAYTGAAGSTFANSKLGDTAHGGTAAVITAERIVVASTTTNEPAVKLTGNGTKAGLLATGGATGSGIEARGGATSGYGIYGLGVGSNSDGILGAGVGSGSGITGMALGASGNGIKGLGLDTGDGLHVQGGTSGRGLHVVGGATSGDGVYVETTSGHGINLAPVGTNKHGILATGGNGGTSDGMKAVAGTGGVPIRGDITGNITGTASGNATAAQGANMDAAVSSRMASYTQPAGFLAATFPSDPADQSLVIAATDALMTAINALNNLSSAQAQTACAAALTAYDPPTNAEMEARTLVAANYATAAALSTAQGNITTILGTTTKVETMIVLDGAVYQFTVNALELGPSGSGASAATIADAVWDEAIAGHATAGTFGATNQTSGSGDTVVIGPVAATVTEASIATSTGGTKYPLTMFQHTAGAVVVAVTDSDDDPVDMTGDAFKVVIHDSDGTVIHEFNSTDEAAQFTLADSGATGGNNDQITVDFLAADTATAGVYQWELRNTTLGVVLVSGRFEINVAPNP